jgi:hypothetical protein
MVWMDIERLSDSSALHWRGMVDEPATTPRDIWLPPDHVPKQHVRFHLPKLDKNINDDGDDNDGSRSDDNSEASPLASHPSVPYLHEDCISQMWWNHDECQAICDDARSVSEFYSTKRSDYTQSFLSVHSFLCRCEDNQAVDQELSLISHTSARGLEVYIFPILNRFRNKAVQDILRAQANLPHHLDIDKKHRMLSAKSKLLSRPARKLAKVLGDGDALVAMKIQEEEMG